jgi:hypothetical protein
MLNIFHCLVSTFRKQCHLSKRCVKPKTKSVRWCSIIRTRVRHWPVSDVNNYVMFRKLLNCIFITIPTFIRRGGIKKYLTQEFSPLKFACTGSHTLICWVYECLTAHLRHGPAGLSEVHTHHNSLFLLQAVTAPNLFVFHLLCECGVHHLSVQQTAVSSLDGIFNTIPTFICLWETQKHFASFLP